MKLFFIIVFVIDYCIINLLFLGIMGNKYRLYLFTNDIGKLGKVEIFILAAEKKNNPSLIFASESTESRHGSCRRRIYGAVIILYSLYGFYVFKSVFNSAEGSRNLSDILGSDKIICSADCRHVVFNIMLSRKKNVVYFNYRLHAVINRIALHMKVSAVILCREHSRFDTRKACLVAEVAGYVICTVCNKHSVFFNICKYRFFCLGIFFHIRVPVEMIGCDICNNRNIGKFYFRKGKTFIFKFIYCMKLEG